jgi:hypothetical protein
MKKINFKKIGSVILKSYFVFVGFWLVFALSFQLFFVYLQFSGQEERASRISNEITWKIDGRFKNNPDNIWYEEPIK